LEELFELEFDDWLPAFAALAVITAPPANNIAATAALQTADIGIIGPPLNACLNYEPRSPIVPRERRDFRVASQPVALDQRPPAAAILYSSIELAPNETCVL
jgi:hypothetical protein